MQLKMCLCSNIKCKLFLKLITISGRVDLCSSSWTYDLRLLSIGFTTKGKTRIEDEEYQEKHLTVNVLFMFMFMLCLWKLPVNIKCWNMAEELRISCLFYQPAQLFFSNCTYFIFCFMWFLMVFYTPILP